MVHQPILINDGTKLAVFLDECGQEMVVHVDEGVSAQEIREDYPECRFSHFESKRNYHAEAQARYESGDEDTW